MGCDFGERKIIFFFKKLVLLCLFVKKLQERQRKENKRKIKVMFGDSFCFLFSKTCFLEYKEKTIFLYFLNKKHVWLVEIKKKRFF